MTTGTPTTGQVGHFTFSNVPMPGTYVITAAKDGYGQVTQVIDLKPGVAQTPLHLKLTAGTGTVDGTLVDSTGAGIGGATVTVGGMPNPTTTTTLTEGVVGGFHLTGIPSTGSFTLTFTKAGYADLTVPVPTGAAAQQMRVTMSKSVGGISGTVTNTAGAGLINVTVTATDGVHQFPVSTTGNSAASGTGGYEIANLPAGRVHGDGRRRLGRQHLGHRDGGRRPERHAELHHLDRDRDRLTMRITVDPPRVELIENQPFSVLVTVTNTGPVIGGYHLRVLGADPAWVTLDAENLSLFPETTQTVRVTVRIPPGVGAGDRRIAVQVRELTPPQAIAVAEIELMVPPREAMRMTLQPMTVICGSTGKFSLLAENVGQHPDHGRADRAWTPRTSSPSSSSRRSSSWLPGNT